MDGEWRFFNADSKLLSRNSNLLLTTQKAFDLNVPVQCLEISKHTIVEANFVILNFLNETTSPLRIRKLNFKLFKGRTKL